jgi:hypothetical protein
MILTDGTTAITFTDELVWLDEFAWNPVQQSKKRAIGGTLIIQEKKALDGRPITLVGDDKVWESRAIVEALHSASMMENQQFTLTLFNGSEKTVMFDKENNPVEVSALFTGQDTQTSDQYVIKALRFIEVL